MSYFVDETELYHHGILGQKWGIRRYQNEDGTLTELGRKRLLKRDGSLTRFGKKHWKYLDVESRNREIRRLAEEGNVEELSKRQNKKYVDLGTMSTAVENRKVKIQLDAIKKDPKYLENQIKAQNFCEKSKIFANKMNAVADVVTNTSDAYNSIARVTNSFGLTALPLINKEGKGTKTEIRDAKNAEKIKKATEKYDTNSLKLMQEKGLNNMTDKEIEAYYKRMDNVKKNQDNLNELAKSNFNKNENENNQQNQNQQQNNNTKQQNDNKQQSNNLPSNPISSGSSVNDRISDSYNTTNNTQNNNYNTTNNNQSTTKQFTLNLFSNNSNVKTNTNVNTGKDYVSELAARQEAKKNMDWWSNWSVEDYERYYGSFR